MSTEVTGAAPLDSGSQQPSPDARRRARLLVGGIFSRRFGGIWVLAALVAFFAIDEPQLFLSTLTFKLILSSSAVTGLLALGAMLPLIAGVFDLSIANVAGFAMVFASWLSIHTSLGPPAIALIVLPSCVLFGCVSALLVTRIGVSSFVATLGVGTIALGITELITAGNSIEPEFSHSFSQLGQGYVLGIPLPFIYVLFLAAVLAYLVGHTAIGRRLQATGGNMEAARLAGVRVLRLQAGVMLAAPVIGGFAGLVLATQVGVASSTTTPALLFPAIAALFLGATQLKDGPNPWGTVLGVLILGTGTKGLQLLSASPAVGELFSGVVLVIAVAISSKAGLERLR